MIFIPELGNLSLESKLDSFNLFLNLLKQNFKTETVKLTEVIALLSQERANTVRSQNIGLKVLAKALYHEEFGALPESANKIGVIPTVKEIEKYQRFELSRNRFPQDPEEYRVVEFKGGRAIAYQNPQKKKVNNINAVLLEPDKKVSGKRQRKPRVKAKELSNNSVEFYVPAENLNWDNKEQAIEWLQKYVIKVVSPNYPKGSEELKEALKAFTGKSWVVSLEFAALFLLAGGYNPRPKKSEDGKVEKKDIAELLKTNTIPESYKPTKTQEKLEEFAEELETFKEEVEAKELLLLSLEEEKLKLEEEREAFLREKEEFLAQIEELSNLLNQTEQEKQVVVAEKKAAVESSQKQAAKHQEDGKAWAHLQKYFSMAFIQQELIIEKQGTAIKKHTKTIKKQKTTIGEQEVEIVEKTAEIRKRVDEEEGLEKHFPQARFFFKHLNKLVDKVSKNGKFSEKVLTVNEIIDRCGTPTDWGNKVVLSYPGLEPYIWCHTNDHAKLTGWLPNIFRSLLGYSPVKKGSSFAYSEDFLELAIWLGSFASSYSPKFSYGNSVKRYKLPEYRAKVDSLVTEFKANSSGEVV